MAADLHERRCQPLPAPLPEVVQAADFILPDDDELDALAAGLRDLARG
jgi:hypothetical protein